ncbi:MAG: hypothetical protein LM564_00170 [Desulfurococcaceae archaeon]|nr:hypothetical protein [Desulfurococcaceae archaeon]
MSSGVEGVKERVVVEEIYEYRGTLLGRTVRVMLQLKDGVLWEIVTSSITEEWVEETHISCMGHSEPVDKCFELALDTAQKLLSEASLTGESHDIYVKRQRGEL